MFVAKSVEPGVRVADGHVHIDTGENVPDHCPATRSPTVAKGVGRHTSTAKPALSDAS